MHYHKKSVRWPSWRPSSNPSQQLMKETVSVSTTNSIAERNFRMLNSFNFEKSNVNMITYESITMKRTNKNPEWQKKIDSWEKIFDDEMGEIICF